MIELKKWARILLVSVLATGMTACGEDGPAEDGANDNGFNNDGTSGLTQEQQKQHLESVAIEVSQMFDSNDQRELIDLANYWERTYSGLDIPREWDEAASTPLYTPVHVLGKIGKALRCGDMSTLAYGSCSYYYEFGKFTGIYEPGRYEWVKVGDSDDIVFRFNNANGAQVVVTVKASGRNGEFVYEDYDKHTVVAPKFMEGTIVENGKTLVHSKVELNLDEAGHHVNYNATAEICNISVQSVMDATDTKITSNGSVAVDGRIFAKYDATVNGQGMATRSEIEHLLDGATDDDFCRVFKTANADVDILGKLQVKARMTDLRTIIDVLDECYDDEEFDSKAQAQEACKNGCNRLAEALKGRLYFNGSSDMEAEIVYTPALDEYESIYYSWWEWYVDPQIKFADGTTYSFEGYFADGRFASVENTWTNLWNSYKQLWR